MRVDRIAVLAAAAMLVCVTPAAGQVKTEFRDKKGNRVTGAGPSDAGSGSRVGTGTVDNVDPEAEKEMMRRRCRQLLTKAAKFVAEENWGAANMALRRAKNLTVDPELGRTYRDLTLKLNRGGKAMLDQADRAYGEKNYVAALRSYERILALFAGQPVGTAARQRLDEARKNPTVRAALLEARAQGMYGIVARIVARSRAAATRPAATRPAATRPADEAKLDTPITLDDITALKAAEFLRLVGMLENIVKSCKGAPTADKAGRLLTEMNADTALKTRLARVRRDRLARQSLAKAEAYHKAGMTQKAVDLYRKVIHNFKGTSQAAKATIALDRLQAAVAAP